MKKLVSKDKTGHYRVIKADIPYKMLSSNISKAIYEIVCGFGELQDMMISHKMLELPFAIGQQVYFEKNGIKYELLVSEIKLTAKEVEVSCYHKDGFSMIFMQKDFELLKEVQG